MPPSASPLLNRLLERAKELANPRGWECHLATQRVGIGYVDWVFKFESPLTVLGAFGSSPEEAVGAALKRAYQLLGIEREEDNG